MAYEHVSLNFREPNAGNLGVLLKCSCCMDCSGSVVALGVGDGCFLVVFDENANAVVRPAAVFDNNPLVRALGGKLDFLSKRFE